MKFDWLATDQWEEFSMGILRTVVKEVIIIQFLIQRCPFDREKCPLSICARPILLASSAEELDAFSLDPRNRLFDHQSPSKWIKMGVIGRAEFNGDVCFHFRKSSEVTTSSFSNVGSIGRLVAVTDFIKKLDVVTSDDFRK
jgi:hypothetical protein